MNSIIEIELDKLFVGKCNVRRGIGDISELVESIRQVRVLEPLIVRPAPHGKFEVVVGSRRYHAAREAGLHKVPCIVREIGDEEAIISSLTENIQRGDISEEEIAIAYITLHSSQGKSGKWTQERFAKQLGISRQWISEILAAYHTVINSKKLA